MKRLESPIILAIISALLPAPTMSWERPTLVPRNTARITNVRSTYIEKMGWLVSYDSPTGCKNYDIAFALCAIPSNETVGSRCDFLLATIEQKPGVCMVKIKYDPAKTKAQNYYIQFIFINGKLQQFPLSTEVNAEVTPTSSTQGMRTPPASNSVTSVKTSEMSSSVAPTRSVNNISTSTSSSSTTNDIIRMTSVKRDSTSEMSSSVATTRPVSNIPTSTSSSSTTNDIIRSRIFALVISLLAVTFILV